MNKTFLIIYALTYASFAVRYRWFKPSIPTMADAALLSAMLAVPGLYVLCKSISAFFDGKVFVIGRFSDSVVDIQSNPYWGTIGCVMTLAIAAAFLGAGAYIIYRYFTHGPGRTVRG
ncbi:hypothetical protein ACFPPA_18950 [Rhodanobacter ginsengisoli]|uniref:Uncharacterized protein n=1 Tax=Rhodanobacter ginsengisoli TaxID=418646 RepID=A0ABW0QUP7_9GAMM